MTAEEEALSRVLESARVILDRARERLGYQTGGFLCLIGPESPVPITTTRLGEICPRNLEGPTRRDAEREAINLFANPALQISTDLRLPEDSGFGGAAIRVGRYIVAFCGYGYKPDQVIVLAIAVELGLLSEEKAIELVSAEGLIQLDSLISHHAP